MTPAGRPPVAAPVEYNAPSVAPPQNCGSCLAFNPRDPDAKTYAVEGFGVWTGWCRTWMAAGLKSGPVTSLSGIGCKAYRWIQEKPSS